MPELIDVIDRAWYGLIERPVLIMAGVTVGTVAVDAVIKSALVAVLPEGHCVPPDVKNVAVCMVHSTGVVTSPTAGVVYAVVAAAVVVVAVGCAWWRRSPTWAVALGLVAGGVAGNLADRLFRGPVPFTGRVVDVFSVGFAFNVADAAIVLGVVIMVVLLRVGRRLDAMLRRPDGSGEHDGLDPDDEKVALANRLRYPPRKWDPVPPQRPRPGLHEPDDPDGPGDVDEEVTEEDVIDEDDRPASARIRHPANKWDR